MFTNMSVNACNNMHWNVQTQWDTLITPAQVSVPVNACGKFYKL